MADTQIANLQSVGAPSDYVLPSSVELQLKAVNAEMDGSGAAGSWLPAVEIVSDAGQVIARALDPGSPVAAGGSAEVSWFPGVKGGAAAVATTQDEYCPQQVVPLFEYDRAGQYVHAFDNGPTIDTACAYNAYLGSTGVVGAFIAFRFSLGPFGSEWGFQTMYRTDPDGGVIRGYLASVGETPTGSGAADPTGLLDAIDSVNYILAFEFDTYSAVTARNVKRTLGAFHAPVTVTTTSFLRVMGQPGDPFTATGYDASAGAVTINGGPGIYALKLIAETKNAASTNYRMRLQSLSASRQDWAYA